MAAWADRSADTAAASRACSAARSACCSRAWTPAAGWWPGVA